MDSSNQRGLRNTIPEAHFKLRPASVAEIRNWKADAHATAADFEPEVGLCDLGIHSGGTHAKTFDTWYLYRLDTVDVSGRRFQRSGKPPPREVHPLCLPAPDCEMVGGPYVDVTPVPHVFVARPFANAQTSRARGRWD